MLEATKDQIIAYYDSQFFDLKLFCPNSLNIIQIITKNNKRKIKRISDDKIINDGVYISIEHMTEFIVQNKEIFKAIIGNGGN
jgi:hypothetical protein